MLLTGDRFMSMFDDDKSAVGKAGARTAKQANGMQSKAPSRANRQHAAAPSSSQEPDILAGMRMLRPGALSTLYVGCAWFLGSNHVFYKSMCCQVSQLRMVCQVLNQT